MGTRKYIVHSIYIDMYRQEIAVDEVGSAFQRLIVHQPIRLFATSRASNRGMGDCVGAGMQ